MADEKTSWDSIPSLDDLTVDWSYEAENPLGNRERIRIITKDLTRILGVKKVPVRVISKISDEKALLIDLDQCGAGVLLKNQLSVKQVIKIGFLLGDEKIVSLAVVKNVNEVDGNFRTGILFKDLKDEHVAVIKAIVTSKNY